MATITSAASGNWSAGATWVGGVVPTAADDVVITSSHNVTADVDITVLSIFANTGILIVSSSRTITTTGAGLTINTGFGSNASGGINITGTGITVTYNGLLRSGDSRAAINIAGNNNTVAINGTGTGTGSTAGLTYAAVASILGNNNTLTYTGNLLNTSTTVTLTIGLIVNSGSGNIINYIGTLNNGTYPSFYNVQTGGVTLSINGIVNKSNMPSVYDLQNAGLTTITGAIIGTQTQNPFFCRTLNMANVSSWQFNSTTLYTPGSALGNPATTDVRSGVSYASGALTGTLVVPSPNAVTAGVTYDNGTIGTAQNTAASFLTALAASSDPLAVRLKNVATVQTTGDQIAAAL